MDRSDLYALVDALPEAALENVKRILEALARSPQEKERMYEIRKQQFIENIRGRPMSPGTAGTAGGVGNLNTAGTAGYWHSDHDRWEDQTASS